MLNTLIQNMKYLVQKYTVLGHTKYLLSSVLTAFGNRSTWLHQMTDPFMISSVIVSLQDSDRTDLNPTNLLRSDQFLV